MGSGPVVQGHGEAEAMTEPSSKTATPNPCNAQQFLESLYGYISYDESSKVFVKKFFDAGVAWASMRKPK